MIEKEAELVIAHHLAGVLALKAVRNGTGVASAPAP